MDERIPGAILSILLFILVLFTAYFFSLTGINTQMFLTINTFPLMGAIFSINFLIFIILSSVCLGIILSIGRKYLLKYALMLIAAGFLPGIILATLLFQKTIIEFALPIILFLIGIPLGIKFLSQKEKELHYLVTFRSGTSAAGRILLIACIGFLACLVIASIGNQDTLKQNFVPEFLGMTIGNGISLGEQFQGQFALSIAEQQRETIKTIQALPEMKSLETKNDPDVLALENKLELMKANVSSNEFKQKIMQNLADQKIDLGGEILKQLPLIATLSSYTWIIYVISGFIIVFFITNLFVKNISSAVYALIMLIYPKNIKIVKKEAKRTAEQNEKK